MGVAVFDLVERELIFVVQINCRYPHQLIGTRARGHIGPAIDCRRADVSAIVVGVLTDQVHSSWCSDYELDGSTQVTGKLCAQVLKVEGSYVFPLPIRTLSR
jgi:hypothetical protein